MKREIIRRKETKTRRRSDIKPPNYSASAPLKFTDYMQNVRCLDQERLYGENRLFMQSERKERERETRSIICYPISVIVHYKMLKKLKHLDMTGCVCVCVQIKHEQTKQET